MKKGYLFTLGMFMVLTIVLALAILLNTTVENTKERLSILNIIDRASELSSSIEKGFKEVLDIYSDFDVIIEENGKVNVTITENISREKDDWGENLDEKVNEFKSFIESQDKNIKLTSGEFDKELPLNIVPYNITYFRSWKTGHVTLNVVPLTFNFDGFNIVINTGDTQIDTVSNASISPGSFKFIVKTIDNNGTDIYTENDIDPTKQNQIIISLVGGNLIKVTVKDTLEIWTNSPSTMNVATTLFGLDKLPDKAVVVYPDIIYNVTFPKFNVIKQGTIQFM